MQMTIAPTLETDRAILRSHRFEDFERFAEIWADPAVTRFVGGVPLPRDEAWTRFLRTTGLWPILGYGYWAIEDRADGRYLGLAGLAELQRGIPRIAGVPEAGWVFGTDAHGRGIATEVVTAIMTWADEALSAPETCCIIDPGNDASVRVAEKAGFSLVGLDDFRGGKTMVFRRALGVAG
jgi:RimJ/RimL family protein N-acetyltransferase